MCRIAGLINPSIPIQLLQSSVKGMCTTLQHGGPDDEGIYLDAAANVCIGHRRLSIIDTSNGGHQPMLFGEGRYVISYNGELYNYKEIRSELHAAGFFCKSQSDTEVVIAAFAAWGIEAFRKFNGMFAFAIYDKVTQQLTLARDPSGMKPLYYRINGLEISFASEVKALRQLNDRLETNQQWPVYFLAYGYLPEPITTFKEIKPLEKGTCITFDCKTGKVERTVFFTYSFMEKIGDYQQAISETRTQLSDAVKRHLIADTPIGVFLSGGLDSSIIALLANQQKARLNTVSLYFEDNQFSEKKYQDLLQERLDCTHQQYLLREADFHEYLPTIIEAMDLPCYDGINTWFISKFAHQSGLKAVLSGIGGDELFGGYPSFSRIRIALMLQNAPDLLLQASGMFNIKKLRRLCYLTIPGPVGRYLFLRGQFIPVEIARYLDATEKEVWDILKATPILPDIDHLTPENQVSWMELNLYMQNQLLRDADVMSMSHGIEIRVPFLDVNVVRLSLKINSELKYAGKYPKHLLIESFKDLLPESIWNRPKMGFSFPFRDWFSNDLYQDVLKGGKAAAAHDKLKSGQIHWSQFYSLMLLQKNI